MQREIADHLRRRGHLGGPAEDLVGGRVHVLDGLELVAEAQRDGLLTQVGQLPAGDLVAVDAAGRRGQARLERRVQAADRLPVGLEVEHGLRIDVGLARRVLQRHDQRRHGRLRRRRAHRGVGDVDGVHARVDGREQRGQLAAGGVVGVQVHGQVEALAQRGHEAATGLRAEKARHVLDREHVRAGVDDLLGEAQVVVERVDGLGGIQQVRGVAEGHLGDRGAGGQHGVDGGPHLADVVHGVEDAEDVDPGGRGLLDESVGDLLRIRGVADGVAAAQQHLQVLVRHGRAQLREPLPRVLPEEPQRDVVGGAAPALDREQVRQRPRLYGGDGDEVTGAHAGGEQRLVGVSVRGVGDADGDGGA